MFIAIAQKWPFKRRTRNSGSSAGFTVLELMIASIVFAVILLVLAVGVIRFSNDYYKGISSAKTQAAARSIMMDISQAIEFSKTVTPDLTGPGGVSGLCVDNTLYSYKLGQEVTDNSPNGSLHQGLHGLVETVGGAGGDCSGASPSLSLPLPVGSRELLGQHMRLGKLSVSGSGTLYTVHVSVIYGDDDLLYPPIGPSFNNWANTTELCTGLTGMQFCAVSDLQTTVERRLL